MRKNYIYYSVLAFLAVLLSAACEKRYEIFDELAVTSHTLNISQLPGETHIAVYSTGTWKISFDEQVDWASVNRLSGEGLGDFVLSWSANYGTSRKVDILVSRDNKTERIRVIQAGSITSPYISLGRTKVVLPKQAADFSVTLTTNLGFSINNFQARAVYYTEGAQPDTLEMGSTSEKAWIERCEILQDRIRFHVKENSLETDRQALLICYVTDAAGLETRTSLPIIQSALDPVFTLSRTEGEYYSNRETHLVPAQPNNIWSMDGVQVSASADWLNALSVTEEGLSFTTAENTDGVERTGVVTVSYTSESGHTAGATFTVTQATEKLLTFEELRARVPGTIHGNYLIEGFIVSDPDSPNLCSSPQTGQFAYDRSENSRTSYLESTDASLGFCLKFTDAAENTLPRWSKVLVHLDGVILEREMSPMRFTLSNLTSAMFTVVNSDDAVPEKTRTIAQLTDADLFTYVSLQDVEILFKDGCYTNASEGYSMKDELNPLGADQPRWDVAPLLCSDSNGNAIYMLTNAAAPWRRTGYDTAWGSAVPSGSGSLSGILVSDNVAPVRWGYLGKYQIRPLNAQDIDLYGARFSNTICEWTWNDKSIKTLDPDEGNGDLFKYDAASKFTYDYNNPYLPTEDSPNGYDDGVNRKGLVVNAALCLTQKWWDFSLNEGKYIDVAFSTAGLSGSNLIFGIAWGHGLSATSLSAPSHWKVLYSINGGSSFNELPSLGILKQRSCAWWSSPQTSQDATPGYTEHLVKLPASCFGKSKVVVRLQVADTITDIAPATSATSWRQALGIEKGVLTPDSEGPVRIGSITVRYN